MLFQKNLCYKIHCLGPEDRLLALTKEHPQLSAPDFYECGIYCSKALDTKMKKMYMYRKYS